MKTRRFRTGLLRRFGPAGLILTGAALALTLPPVREGLKNMATKTAEGTLSAVEEVRELGSNLLEKAGHYAARFREMEIVKDTSLGSSTGEEIGEEYYPVKRRLVARAKEDRLKNVAPDGLEVSELDITRSYYQDQSY